ncbi:hypothetical protein [Sphingosinicella sp. BN140058]|uniref:hypothetical protein n=1 Tax=Sphingosinicella sp. BN140058 TaxID=1892855 RepID=UPI0010125A5A|nr:hypothetical protein [Sphingosinicella sp. BN140058]QAY79371.1 hypothetical protein ETR14_24635 [Sphingosinicella sp. BN140058]
MSDIRDSNTSTAANDGNEGGGRLAGVRQSAADAYQNTRERTSAAYESARERAGSALDSVRQTARSAGERTGSGIEANPMAAVVGGLALGIVAGAILPRSKREQALLAPAGRKIHDTARQAVSAAKDAGREQIGELGLTRDSVQRRLGEFTDRAVGAVKTSAGAAAETVTSSNH